MLLNIVNSPIYKNNEHNYQNFDLTLLGLHNQINFLIKNNKSNK